METTQEQRDDIRDWFYSGCEEDNEIPEYLVQDIIRVLKDVDSLHSRNEQLEDALMEADAIMAEHNLRSRKVELVLSQCRAEARGNLGDMVVTSHAYGSAMRTPDGRVLSPLDFTTPPNKETKEGDL